MQLIAKAREYYNKNDRENNLAAIWGQEVDGWMVSEFLWTINSLSRFPDKLQVLWKLYGNIVGNE